MSTNTRRSGNPPRKAAKSAAEPQLDEIVEFAPVAVNGTAATAPAAESGEITAKAKRGKKAAQDTTEAKDSMKEPKRTKRALEKEHAGASEMDFEPAPELTTRRGRKPVAPVPDPTAENSNKSEESEKAQKRARSSRAKVDKREEVERDASKASEKKAAGGSNGQAGKEAKARGKKKAEPTPAADTMETDEVVEGGEGETQKNGRGRGTGKKVETKAKEAADNITKKRAGRKAAAKKIDEEKDEDEESENEVGDVDEDRAEGAKANIDLYAEFGIARTASQDEIKKAYRKLALQYHPDKVKQASAMSDSDAGEYIRQATEKFQQLSKYYEVLSNPAKRARYDATGIFDEEGGASKPDFETFEGWYDHFRSLWELVTSEQIDAYEKTYRGSKEQEEDIIEAYGKCNGSMDGILEHVPFATPEDEQFIMGVVEAGIREKTIVSTKSWKSSTTAKQREKRMKELEKEHAEFEKQNIEADLALLGAVIRKKGQDRMEGVVEALEKKYGGGARGKRDKKGESKPVSEPTEEEFLALQMKMDEERAAKKGGSSDKDVKDVKAARKRGGKSTKDTEEADIKKRKSQDVDEVQQAGNERRGGRKKAKAN